MDHNDWSFRRKLVAQIQDQIGVESAQLLNGGCQSFEDYKHRSGKVSAFNEVLAMIDEIIDAMTGRDSTET